MLAFARMRSGLKIVVALILIVALLLGGLTVNFLRLGGQFRTLAPHFAGSCTALPMQASAADIQIDRPRGIAYLSYLDRRSQFDGQAVLGTIMLLDLSLPEPRPRPALMDDPPNFRPHGLSLYRAGDGSERLFAISHPPGQANTIEVFEQGATGAFKPIRSIRDELLRHPHALLAVGPNQFYVVNDSGASSDLGRAIETLLGRAISSLLFFDGEKMRVLDAGIASGTGIAMSLDGRQIFVSEASANRIRVYARNPASGDLALVDKIDIGSAAQTINLAGDGSLWIAAHPKALALLRHFRDAAKRSPTQIFRLDAGATGAARLKEIYLDNGEQLSAGSVAAAFGNEMLIGSVTERKLLRCRIP